MPLNARQLRRDPQTADPQTADPQTADPQTADPQTSDPQTSDRPTTPRAKRYLHHASVVYLVGVALYAVAGGAGWPWLLLSVVPPLTFVGAPLVLVALAVLTTQWRHCWQVLTAAVGIGVYLLGLNPSALLPDTGEDHAGQQMHVTSWNTEYWDQTDRPDEFYAYLDRNLHDVMVLQEAIRLGPDGTSLVPLDVVGELSSRVPGVHVVQQGELVVLSRLPVEQVINVNHDVLRVDVRAGPSALVSVYDVHLPTQMDLNESPLSGAFYRTVASRYDRRNAQLDSLVADLGRNRNPSVVAGDFNTSQSMGSIRPLQRMSTDAVGASRSLLPSSWNAHQEALLFRLDWMFTRNGLEPARFTFVDPEGMSDHDLQDAVVSRVP